MIDFAKHKALDLAEAELKTVQDIHYKYVGEIKQFSGRAIQGKDPKLTDRIYRLCLDDIALIPMYNSFSIPFAKLWRELYPSEPPISNFQTAYETLAFIEQKRNNSAKSIDLCKEAIKNGANSQRMNDLITIFSKPYKPRIIHPAYTKYWK